MNVSVQMTEKRMKKIQKNRRKTGADERKGSPLEAVDARKQQKIFRTAMYYLTEQQLEDVPCRFDVVGIEGTKITLIKNAFGG